MKEARRNELDKIIDEIIELRERVDDIGYWEHHDTEDDKVADKFNEIYELFEQLEDRIAEATI